MAAANGGASAAAHDALSDLLPDEEDLLYEEVGAGRAWLECSM